MSKILITGSSSGLGKEIYEALLFDGHEVLGYDIKNYMDVRRPNGLPPPQLDVLINCAGINRQNWLEDVEDEDWDRVMDVNAKGIYKMSKWALPELIKTKGTILNIIGNASHIPTVTNFAYNASEGAAHIMTLQMALELTKRYGITVFGISPNKLADTEMSKSVEEQTMKIRGWTKYFTQQQQINSIVTGEETDPKQIAEFIAFLLSSKKRHKYLSGCVLPYGA